jgi:hypothetical protein
MPEAIYAVVDIQPMIRECSINLYDLSCFMAKIIILFVRPNSGVSEPPSHAGILKIIVLIPR